MKQFTKLWQIAFFTALATNTAIFVCLSLFRIVTYDHPFFLLFTFISTTLISYFLVLFMVRIFVYRKVKPIYKIIRRTKLEKNEKRRRQLSDDILEQVENEVQDWLDSTKTEMETLQTLEEYRRDYLGNISHELKTPIFNMQGYIHSLLDGAMYDKKYLKSFLEKAAKNVDRLDTIVQDLDIINKIESNKVMLEIEKFSIDELVSEVIEDTKSMAKRKKIKVYMKENATKPIKVKADRNAIRQVLTNLITNSIKYGREKGETKIGFYDMDTYVLVEVTDDGLGIEKEHLPHLFDRFYRVDKSRSRDIGGIEGGSGIGLAIVKHLIEAHDQTISVRSTVNVGSTFGFTLEKAR